MKIEAPTRNVFRSLGFEEPDASNLRTRSQLMIEIQSIVEAEGMSQKDAAERFGTSQPRISALLKGRIDKFSIDALMNMLNHAGRPVAVVTRETLRALPATTTRRKVINTIFPNRR